MFHFPVALFSLSKWTCVSNQNRLNVKVEYLADYIARRVTIFFLCVCVVEYWYQNYGQPIKLLSLEQWNETSQVEGSFRGWGGGGFTRHPHKVQIHPTNATFSDQSAKLITAHSICLAWGASQDVLWYFFFQNQKEAFSLYKSINIKVYCMINNHIGN